MTAKLIDLPPTAAGRIGFGSIPGFGISFGNQGEGEGWFTFSDLTPGGYGPSASYTVGLTDMTHQFFHASGTARAGIFGDGSLDAGAHFLGKTGFFGSRYNASAGSSDNGRQTISTSCLDALDTPVNGGASAIGLFLGNLCSAFAGSVTLNSSTGHQSVTGVGFQPDFVAFIGAIPYGDGLNSTTSPNGTNFCFGVMDASGNQWALTDASIFVSSPISRMSRFRTDRCLMSIGVSGTGGSQATTVDQSAEFVSMDADGFTINLTAAGLNTSSVASTIAYLAVKVDSGAGQIVVGNGVQSDAAVVAGFAPDAMLFASNQAASQSQTTTAFTTIGAVAGTRQRCAWGGGASSPTTSENYFSTASSIRFALPGETLLAEASASLNANGCYLNWTADDAAGRLFGWVAFQVDTSNLSPAIVTNPPFIAVPDATLKATVTPNTTAGTFVSYQFQYGATPSYGTTTTLTTDGDGATPTPVGELLMALPFGIYHYRGVAKLGSCFYYGDDVEFTLQRAAVVMRGILSVEESPGPGAALVSDDPTVVVLGRAFRAEAGGTGAGSPASPAATVVFDSTPSHVAEV